MNKMLIEKWWKTATNADLLIELARGASLMAQSKDGCTPLHLAVSYGKPTHMRILLHWGADPMALDNYNLTPIFYWRHNDPRIIQILAEANPSTLGPDEAGYTLLHDAARFGDFEITPALLSAGANIEARDKYGFTPLHEAAYMADYDTIHVLLTAGANAKVRTKIGTKATSNKTAWDIALTKERLKGTKAYWELNEAQYE